MKQTNKKGEIPVSKYLKYLWILFLAPLLIVALIFVLVSYGKLGFMPSFEQLENPKSNLATEVYTSDMVVLGTYFKENRMKADYSELSPFLIDALVATEDARFYKHSGVDFRGLGRVLVKTVIGGNEGSGGGSTISQQLAKLLFPRERFGSVFEKVNRKLREWVIAVKLERSYTKEEILTMYFNEFDFLNLAVGIKSASKVYFNCKPADLKIEQAAMLVGMFKNPSMFNPIRKPKNTLERRNVVLSQMLKYKKITSQQYDSLTKLPLSIDFQRVDHKEGSAPYLREYMRMAMSAMQPDRENYFSADQYHDDSLRWETDPLYGWCNKNKKSDGSTYDLYRDGLKIYTTINSKMQRYAELAVDSHMTEIQKNFFIENKGKAKAPFGEDVSNDQISTILTLAMHGSDRYRNAREQGVSEEEIQKQFMKKTKMKVFAWKGEIDTVLSPWDSIRYMRFFLHTGLMSVEPETGYIKAYVGGINYKYFQYDHVIVQKRQVGSTFKPFLYTLAMQDGLTPCFKVANVPTTFYVNDTTWTPVNSDDLRKGEMVSLAWGLANSNNFVSAKLMQMFKPEPVVALAHEMGIKSQIPAVPSICLGVADLSLYEMVGAYGVFANKGVWSQPIFVTRIEDKYGNVISTFTPKRNDAISEKTAFLMLNMLENVVNHGTSMRLRFRYGFRNMIAAKTGTTNNHSDGWFIGIVPHLVTGIWVGGEERSIRFHGLRLGQGATMALPTWAYYMQKVYADSSNLGYKPQEIFEKPEGFQLPPVWCNDKEDNASAEGGGESVEDLESEIN
jgi:penicillin-binding protein 1A